MGPSLGDIGFRSLESARKKAPEPVQDFALQFLKTSAFKSDGEAAAKEISRAAEETFSVKRVHFLGRGLYGAAGLVEGSERDVLKLTSDPSDVEASIRIVKEALPHVARVHAAGFLAGVIIVNRPDRQKTEVGMIIQEAVNWIGLDELGQEDKLRYEVYRVKVDNLVFNRGVGYQPEERRIRMMKASLDLRNKLWDLGEPFIQIASGLLELHDLGIYPVDVHSANVGWSELDRVFKIFDLGFSVIVG